MHDHAQLDRIERKLNNVLAWEKHNHEILHTLAEQLCDEKALDKIRKDLKKATDSLEKDVDDANTSTS